MTAATARSEPDERPTLLLAPEAFDLAETTRMIEVARACGERWQIEFMCHGGRFVHLITQAGFACHCLAPDLTTTRVEELARALRMESGGRMFTTSELVTRVNSELRLYEALRPAAIVTGFILSAYISARAAHIPLVTVAPLAVTRPFFEAGLATFPDNFERGPLRLVPRPIKDAATNWWGLHTRKWLGPFNEAARLFRMPPFRRLVDLVEADEMLITSIPEIVGLNDLPAHWRYVGPIFAHLEGEVPDEVRALPRDQPLVYFSLGSLPNEDILDRLLDALGQLPIRAVAPIATMLHDQPHEVPPNVHVFDLLPAHKVCPLFDVALIHGGEGTVQTACATGVPFVGIAFTPEQDANIGFLARYGTAIRLGRREIDAAHLARDFAQLLQPEVHERASALQELLAAWDGPSNVARFLERYQRPVAAVEEVAEALPTLRPEPWAPSD